MGALPIPYAIIVGDLILVDSLFKDKPIYCEVNYTTSTTAGQIKLVCTTNIVIIKPNPDLVINYLHESNPEPTRSTSTAPKVG